MLDRWLDRDADLRNRDDNLTWAWGHTTTFVIYVCKNKLEHSIVIGFSMDMNRISSSQKAYQKTYIILLGVCSNSVIM